MGAVKHGGNLLLKRGIIGRGKRKLAAAVDNILKEYRADLGGDVSTGQEVMLAQLRRCLLFMSLIDSWLSKQAALVDKDGNLPPALSNFYLSALNSSCRIARELGLERKTEGASLEAYLQGKARQAQDTQPAKPMMKDTGQPEKSPHNATSQGISGGES